MRVSTVNDDKNVFCLKTIPFYQHSDDDDTLARGDGRHVHSVYRVTRNDQNTLLAFSSLYVHGVIAPFDIS